MVCLGADTAKRTMLLCHVCERGCHVGCHKSLVATPYTTDGAPDYTHRGEWECPKCAPEDYVPLSRINA